MKDKLLDIVKNRSVAVVGNADSLFSKKYGSEIDSHDIVIRFNKPAIFYDKFLDKIEVTHGKKIDLWGFVSRKSFNDAVINKEKLDDVFLENFHNNDKIQKIYMRGNPYIEGDIVYPYYGKLISDIDRNMINYNKENTLKLSRRFRNSRKFFQQPTTGLMTLHWLSLCDVLQIDIYGFDFKKTPTFSEHHRFNQDVKHRMDIRCNHNFEIEEEYVLKTLIPNNKNIRLIK